MASRHDDEDLFDSNEDLPHSFNLNDLCRFCARPSQDMIQIFGAEGIRRELEQKINLCLPIKVDINDSLPLSLCRPCVSRVEQSHEMATMCQQADLTLRRLQQRLAQEQPTDSGTTDVKFFDIKEEILEDEPRLEVDALVINQKFKCEVCKVGFDSNLEAINHCSQEQPTDSGTMDVKFFDIKKEILEDEPPIEVDMPLINQKFKCEVCKVGFDSNLEAINHCSQLLVNIMESCRKPENFRSRKYILKAILHCEKLMNMNRLSLESCRRGEKPCIKKGGYKKQLLKLSLRIDKLKLSLPHICEHGNEDIFKISPEIPILHCISNCKSMSEGFALEICNVYPELRNVVTGQVGTVCAFHVSDSRLVINLITKPLQHHISRIDQISKCLANLKCFIDQNEIKNIAFPKICSGCDWNEILQMLSFHLWECDVTLHLFLK